MGCPLSPLLDDIYRSNHPLNHKLAMDCPKFPSLVKSFLLSFLVVFCLGSQVCSESWFVFLSAVVESLGSFLANLQQRILPLFITEVVYFPFFESVRLIMLKKRRNIFIEGLVHVWCNLSGIRLGEATSIVDVHVMSYF